MLKGGCVAGLVLMGCAGMAMGGGTATTTAFVIGGDPVPGMAGFTFTGGGAVSLADDGGVLFVATISGAGSNSFNDHVLVIERADGTREVLAREADPVPGLVGYVYRGGSANTAVFNSPVLASDGTIGVGCEVLTGATVRDAVLTTAPVGPGLTVTAYETMPVVADLGDAIQLFDAQSVSIHSGGLVSFGGRVIDDVEGVAESIWYGSSLGIMTSLQTKLPAPGFLVDVISFEQEDLVSSALGEVVFGATLDLGSGITSANRRVLYGGDPTNLGVIAQTGTLAPGAGGATFAGFATDTVRMNAAGAVCFFANLNTTSGPPGVLMSYGDGGGFALVKDGDPVAAYPGLTHDVIGGRAEMNAIGEIAFVTQLGGAPFASDTALFVGDPLGIDVVVREGDVIDGHVVEHIGAAGYFAINDRGDVVVELTLDGELAFVAFPGDGGLPWVMARQTEILVTDRGGFALGALVPWRVNTTNGSNGVGRTMPLDNNGRFALNVIGGTGSWIVIFDLDGEAGVCVADFTGDGALDFFDLSSFLMELSSMTARSDLNEDGSWDFFDVSAFLMAYSAGCP